MPAVTDGSPNSASLLNAVNNAYGITPRPVTLPADPYFILQVSNISPDVFGGYASATLVINRGYYVFGNEWQKPISPGYNQSWSTAASAQPPAIIESNDLNNLFKKGAQSFTTSQILVNGYNSDGSVRYPDAQVECKMGKYLPCRKVLQLNGEC